MALGFQGLQNLCMIDINANNILRYLTHMAFLIAKLAKPVLYGG